MTEERGASGVSHIPLPSFLLFTTKSKQIRKPVSLTLSAGAIFPWRDVTNAKHACLLRNAPVLTGADTDGQAPVVTTFDPQSLDPEVVIAGEMREQPIPR